MFTPFNNLTGVYLTSIGICLLAFLFPATRLTIGPQISVQYLLTSYPGWVALIVLLLYIIIQGIFFYKNQQWKPWPAAVIGLYLAGFAVSVLYKSFTVFQDVPPDSLSAGLATSSQTLAAPWALAIGGIMLLTASIIKITRHLRAITQKRSS